MLPLSSSSSVFVRAAPYCGLKRTRVEGLRKKMRAIAQNVKVTGLWDMRRLTNTDYQTDLLSLNRDARRGSHGHSWWDVPGRNDRGECGSKRPFHRMGHFSEKVVS